MSLFTNLIVDILRNESFEKLVIFNITGL